MSAVNSPWRRPSSMAAAASRSMTASGAPRAPSFQRAAESRSWAPMAPSFAWRRRTEPPFSHREPAKPPDSEFLHPGPEVELQSPGALRLAVEMPVAAGDGVGREPAFLGILADAAIDDDVGDMDALWSQLARHALGERPEAELADG